MDRREALYGRFIDQAAALFIDAIDKDLENPTQLIEVIAIVSRIRLSAAQEVVDASEAVMRELLSAYQRPPLDPREIFSQTRETFTDPLALFTLACRREREKLLAQS